MSNKITAKEELKLKNLRQYCEDINESLGEAQSTFSKYVKLCKKIGPERLKELEFKYIRESDPAWVRELNPDMLKHADPEDVKKLGVLYDSNPTLIVSLSENKI